MNRDSRLKVCTISIFRSKKILRSLLLSDTRLNVQSRLNAQLDCGHHDADI